MKLYRRKIIDNEYEDLFYELFYSYNVKIKKDYQFFYDDVFKHIMEDTNNQVEKNFNPNKPGDKEKYRKIVFKSCFYKHFSHSNFGDKLLNPDKYLNKELRKKKLQKLNGINT